MGKDVLGYRRLFGVLGPSTNTIVQPDFDDLRPPGVTNHYSRIFTPDSKAISNETFTAGTHTIAAGVIDAVRSVMTCEPDYLVMGMSAVTFYGGAKGADEFQRKVEREAGISISIGAHACAAALKAYGGVQADRVPVAVLPGANAEVRNYFKDMGYETVRDIPLQAPSWTASRRFPSRLRDTLRELDGPDVDAIVQVGTNLSMVRLAAAAELWLGKPVIAINTATYWHALRANGIQDRMRGFGALLEQF
jgi:maleate isomerase